MLVSTKIGCRRDVDTKRKKKKARLGFQRTECEQQSSDDQRQLRKDSEGKGGGKRGTNAALTRRLKIQCSSEAARKAPLIISEKSLGSSYGWENPPCGLRCEVRLGGLKNRYSGMKRR